MKEFDKVFHSEKTSEAKFQLANGYISLTEVYFEKEKIAAKIEAAGYVEFFDCEDRPIGSIDIPEQTGGKNVYTEVICTAEGNTVVLKFPVVEWIDNYPNCDGEHDRWDTRTIGYHTLTLDTETKHIALIEK